jgi:hypothetical protein
MPARDRSAPQHERAFALACVVRWPVPDIKWQDSDFGAP